VTLHLPAELSTRQLHCECNHILQLQLQAADDVLQMRKRRRWIHHKIKEAQDSIIRTKRHIVRFKYWLRQCRCKGVQALDRLLHESGGISENIFPGKDREVAWRAADEAAFCRIAVVRRAKENYVKVAGEVDTRVKEARKAFIASNPGTLKEYCYRRLQEYTCIGEYRVERAAAVLQSARHGKAEGKDLTDADLQYLKISKDGQELWPQRSDRRMKEPSQMRGERGTTDGQHFRRPNTFESRGRGQGRSSGAPLQRHMRNESGDDGTVWGNGRGSGHAQKNERRQTAGAL
jgi:hypothetical protein